ncbi:cysteine dioxygenase [Actinoalloteichus hymeniacidonis]|uniref:Cysteine dioxygenase type I n=1 Tax=Actinoalloteichus hymeniacidonis TaxID=340345 RepID=A0AAC9HN06_9PSEU|nr:cysteine dioxygenase family protein [Actinoalloteichus hymeniacidonis]AOS62139.1 Cysteine dioxygenase type I [Actinoalloteichus hymeniacidonis]MBB5909839.1 putative RmlC-like cupin family protein [Actinoalloteichus hymeniacidonis]
MTSTLPAFDVHADFDHPELRSWIPQDRLLWTPTELRDLTTIVAKDLAAELHELAEYVPEQRWWARLALTEGVELWLLTWLPAQGTAPHDHAGAAGSFTVLSGRVTEHYRYAPGPVRTRTHLAGPGIGFGPRRAHQVLNLSDAPAATVHAYSPPLLPTREYADLSDIREDLPRVAGATS